jgi:hypothetical protein
MCRQWRAVRAAAPRRFLRGAVTVHILSVIAVHATALVGCAGQPSIGVAGLAGEPATVPVVRVCTASGARAGIPLTRWGVLSTRSTGGDCSIAVVDGTPARAYLMALHDVSIAPDFSILFSVYPASVHGPLHIFDGGCVANVVLAGFRFADNPSPVEVLRTPAEVVCASIEEELGDDVVVRAPAGCYAGFVGGPAGEYRAGSFSVWGIITGQLEERESGEYSYLCVRKLPSEVINRPAPPVGRRPLAILSAVRQLWLLTYGLPVNSVSAPPVLVLHIDSGLRLGSGFAVTEDLIVTAAHVAAESEVLAVDGLPARVIARGAGGPGHAGDWAIARAINRQVHPLPLDEREELPEGQRVILGGLPGPVDWSVPGAFLEEEPVFVEGVVRKSQREPGGPVVRIDVPVADYHGVSGGPVITVGDDGQMRLWGFLTGIAWPLWPVDWVLGYTGLLVTPIPRELQTYAPGTFPAPAPARSPLGPWPP